MKVKLKNQLNNNQLIDIVEESTSTPKDLTTDCHEYFIDNDNENLTTFSEKNNEIESTKILIRRRNPRGEVS